MSNTAKNIIDDINVVEEFLNEDENNEINDKSPARFLEEFEEDTYQDNQYCVEKNSVLNADVSEDITNYYSKQIQQEEEKKTVNEDESIVNVTESNSEETFVNDNLLEKIKKQYEGLKILIDALERQVLENNSLYTNQKEFINKLEGEYREISDEAGRFRSLYEDTVDKLKKAEKKLDIVKKELLD